MSNFQYFKFRSINKYFIDSLIKGTLYFALPKQLNDPFDCNLDIKKSIKNALAFHSGKRILKLENLLKKDKFFEDLQAKINTCGVCSFSLNLKQPIMWSHYASEHKGVCVLYDFPEEFLDNRREIIGVSKLSYEQDVLTNWFINIDEELFNNPDEFLIKLLKVVLTAKAPSWRYEEEARIIRPSDGPFKIPISFIRQICFGLQTPPEDKELIKLILDGFDTPVSLCEIVRTDSDFGIDVKEI